MKRTIIWLLCIITIWFAPAIGHADVKAPAPDNGTWYVLAIGIDDYEFLSNLRSAAHNAQLMASVFDPAHTTILINKQATKATIINALNQYQTQLQPQDKLLIYYSGQGSQSNEQSPMQNMPWQDQNVYDETLIPVDATYQNDSQINCDALSDILKKLPTQQITIMMDCSYNRTTIRPTLPTFQQVKTVRHPRSSIRDLTMYGYTVLMAADRSETAWDAIFNGQPSGIFTYYFVQGITSRAANVNANGQLTIRSGFDYAQAMTIQHIGVQHPHIYRGENPNIPLW